MRAQERLVVVGLLALAIIPRNANAQDLLVASQDGDLEAVRTFVSAGADLAATRGDGMNALHLASERGHTDVAIELVVAGVPVEAGTRIGAYTPLHLAALAGHSTICARDA